MTRGLFSLVTLGLFLIFAIIGIRFKDFFYSKGILLLRGPRTIEQVINKLKIHNESNVKKYLSDSGFGSFPSKLTFVVIKDKKILELWFENESERKYIKEYNILAASGKEGPKLMSGDRQVPEGIYKIEYLNPNSSYHLSMKINYPNEFDKKAAQKEGRKNLGGDIFIHGRAVSIGCLAMGDLAIEELFYMVEKVGKENVKVIIAPYDFREKEFPKSNEKEWVNELYEIIDKEIKNYKVLL